MYYYNFSTRKVDDLDRPPSDFNDYIPDETAKNIYRAKVQLGIQPLEAFIQVLEELVDPRRQKVELNTKGGDAELGA